MKSTPTTTSPDTEPDNLAAVKQRLQDVGQLIAATDTDLRRLYDERVELFDQLRSAGVSRNEMADLAGVSPGMVKFALGVGRRSAPTGG